MRNAGVSSTPEFSLLSWKRPLTLRLRDTHNMELVLGCIKRSLRCALWAARLPFHPTLMNLKNILLRQRRFRQGQTLYSSTDVGSRTSCPHAGERN